MTASLLVDRRLSVEIDGSHCIVLAFDVPEGVRHHTVTNVGALVEQLRYAQRLVAEYDERHALPPSR